VILSSSANFLIIFSLFTLFLIVTGTFPGWAFVALIPVLCVQVLFAVGVGVALGVLNVFFRDVGQLSGIVLQFWFWLTPIVYPASVLGEGARALMAFNPMAVLIESYQQILVSGNWPQWEKVAIVAVVSLALCALALRLFRVRSGEMVDEL
jgi:lipopolysaccharide transport system permease protein